MPGNIILRLLVLLLLSTVTIHLSKAQITLTDYSEDLSVSGLEAEILEDSSKELSIEEVKKKNFIRPVTIDLKNINPESAYWVRFRVKNKSAADVKWVLEALTPNLYSLEVYIPDEEGRMNVHTSGLSKNPFKEYPHKNYVFDLPSDLEDFEVYIRAWSPNVTGLEFKIRSQQFFTWYALNEYYFLGMYYGILLIMLLYNLLIFITNREKVYLFYSLYLAACMFLTLSEDGLGIELLWGNYSSANLYLYYYLAPSLFLVSFVLYARSFLNLQAIFPLADKAALTSAFLYAGVNLIQSFSSEVFRLEDYFIVPFIIIFAASLYVFRKGYKPARFFILGYSIVFLSMIILQLRLHRIIEANIFTVYIFNSGILVETVILSYALADRLKIIRREKQKADTMLVSQLQKNTHLQQRLVQELLEKNDLNEKVNRELEQKVQERTQELIQKTVEVTEANAKLDMLYNKLKDSAIKLDIDNWELKKEVKKERTARVVQQELSYQDFVKVFPDKNTCLRYLEELKWGKTYCCRKCGNEKFSEKQFSRRCTRCNYIESPTSHTLFHAIKIPLDKAFYMIYAASNKSKKLTLDEMSGILNIGKNTCWDFRKKIKQRQTEKKKLLGLKEVESWDMFILD